QVQVRQGAVVEDPVERADLVAQRRGQLRGELGVGGLHRGRGRGGGGSLRRRGGRRGAGAGRAGGVLHYVDRRHRARVGDRGAGDRAGGLAVREALAVVQGQRGLGVVLLAQRGPDGVALGDAVSGLGRLLDQRGLHFSAAAATEQATDDGRDGDDV